MVRSFLDLNRHMIEFLYLCAYFVITVIFPGHEESYNPPPEYLPTEEEVNAQQLLIVFVLLAFYDFEVIIHYI